MEKELFVRAEEVARELGITLDKSNRTPGCGRKERGSEIL